jgi:hypothetical protein
MAATILTRASNVAQKLRKALAATAVVLLADGDQRADVLTQPTISAGSGAPQEPTPPAVVANGSLYLRTDGTNGTDSVYVRIAGAWVALAG